MRYTVYKTTNTINGKVYVGVHETEDPMDDYIGSGRILQRAIKKYGKDHFRKEVLFDFDTRTEMIQKEIEIVTPAFVANSMTYNANVGGHGAWGHRGRGREVAKEGPERSLWLWKNDPVWRDEQLERLKRSAFGSGQPNPTTGKIWMHNADGKNVLIYPDEINQRIEEGWIRGRIIPPHVNAALQANRGRTPSGLQNPMSGRAWMHNPDKTIRKAIPACEIEAYLAQGWTRGKQRKRSQS